MTRDVTDLARVLRELAIDVECVKMRRELRDLRASALESPPPFEPMTFPVVDLP